MSIATNDASLVSDMEQDTHAFTLRLGGRQEITADLERALFEAGCDDALLSSCEGELHLQFDRIADTLRSAILSAIRAVEHCGCGLTVVEVIPPGQKAIHAVNAYLKLRNEDPGLLAEFNR